jgi:chromosome segregation ATPase
MSVLIGLSFLVVARLVAAPQQRGAGLMMKEAVAQTVTPRITVEPAAEPMKVESEPETSYRDEPPALLEYPPLPNPARSVSRLKEYISGLEQSNKEFQEKFEQINRSLSAKDVEIAKLNDELASLGADYDRIYDMYMKLKAEHDAYAQKFAGLSDAGIMPQQSAEMNAYARYGFESQIKELTTKIADLTAAKIDMEEKLGQARRERSDMEQERAMARDDLAREKVTTETLGRKIASLNEELAKKDGEIRKLELPRSDLEAQVGTLKAVKEEYERRISLLNDQIGALRSSEESLRNDVARLTAFITKRELEHEFALQEKAGELAAAGKSIEEARTESVRLKSVVHEQEKSLADLKDGQMKELLNKIASLRSQLALAERKREEAARSVEAHERANVRLETMIKKMRMELEMRAVEERFRGNI